MNFAAEMNLALQVSCFLLGVFYLIAGALKVCGHAHMVDEFDNFNYPQWLRVVTGCIELVAAPMMLSVFWSPMFAAAGSLLMCPVMIGASYTNFVKRSFAFGAGTLVLLVLCALPVAWFVVGWR